MGMIDRFIGMGATVSAVGNAATGVAGIFAPNANRRMELDEEAYARALAELQAEFSAAHVQAHWFDCLMNGLNRLPRPLLTLGTIGLFIYAMADPAGFSARMEGLALVPEPLWWLMGAIVSFYFGAREAHYLRQQGWTRTIARVTAASGSSDDDGWRAPAPPLPDGGEGAAATASLTSDPRAPTGDGAGLGSRAVPITDDFTDNPALRDWIAARGGAPR